MTSRSSKFLTIYIALFMMASNCALVKASDAGERISRDVDQPSISYSYNMVKQAQRMLIDLGYKPGPVDGIWGPNTSSAVSKYQQDNNLTVTGKLDGDTKIKLFKQQ